MRSRDRYILHTVLFGAMFVFGVFVINQSTKLTSTGYLTADVLSSLTPSPTPSEIPTTSPTATPLPSSIPSPSSFLSPTPTATPSSIFERKSPSPSIRPSPSEPARTPTPAPVSRTPVPTSTGSGGGGATKSPSISPSASPSLQPSPTPSPTVVAPTIAQKIKDIGVKALPIIKESGAILKENVEKNAEPVAYTTSAGVAISTASGIVSLTSSGISWLNYVQFIFKNLLIFLGIKRKSRPWGTVYDAVTKQPLAYAKVKLVGADMRVLETHITDREGRYGFLTDIQKTSNSEHGFQIFPEIKGFKFPSQEVTGSSDPILYPHVYNGGSISVQSNSPIAFDIPLDPQNRPDSMYIGKKVHMKLRNLFAHISNSIFWIALVTVPLSYILNPSFVNLIMLIVFMGLNLLIFVGELQQRPFGVIVSKNGNYPLPYALVTLNDDASGLRKAFTVSDNRGRYFLLSEKGSFKLSAFSPAHVSPQRSTEELIKTDKGWIAKKLTL